mgnify:FL=1
MTVRHREHMEDAMAQDQWQSAGWESEEDFGGRESPRKWRSSDIAGSHALLDRDFDEDDGWKEDVENLVPSMGM